MSMTSAHLLDVLQHLVDHQAEQCANVPLGQLDAQVHDMVIPTDDVQDTISEGVRVSFATYAYHRIVRPNRLALPDWLKVHRAGDVRIVCVVVSCDFTLPESWCWLPAALPARPLDQDPYVTQRIILATLNDGKGVLRLEKADDVSHGWLPGLGTGAWPKALHGAAVTYLSHRPSTSIIGDESRLPGPA
jgi:hypothetical protein